MSGKTGNFMTAFLRKLRKLFAIPAGALLTWMSKVKPNKIIFMTFNHTYSCNPKYIAQELLGKAGIDPEKCTVGISSTGVLCVTHPDSRKIFPTVFKKGVPMPDMTITDALNDFSIETVIINGQRPQTLYDIVEGNEYTGTHFLGKH